MAIWRLPIRQYSDNIAEYKILVSFVLYVHYVHSTDAVGNKKKCPWLKLYLFIHLTVCN